LPYRHLTVLEKCIYLKELGLDGTQIDNELIDLIAKNIPHIECLNFGGSKSLNEECVPSLTHLESLRKLSLRNCINLKNSFGKLLKHIPKRIELLDVGFADLEPQDLNQIQSNSFAFLKYLDLCEAKLDLALFLNQLQTFPELNTLILNNVSTVGIFGASSSSSGRSTPTLNNNNLNNNNSNNNNNNNNNIYPSNELIDKLAKVFSALSKKLSILSVGGADFINNKTLECICVSIGENLIQLNISNCSEITDSAFVSLTKNCYKLEKLLASGCRIGDVAVNLIADLHYLKHLDLSKCLLGRKRGE